MIKIKVNSNVNFLMILYEISKNPKLFPEIRTFLKKYNINKKERNLIKQSFNKGNVKSSLKYGPKLNKIYLLNKKAWEKYWNYNLNITKGIEKGIKKELEKFDVSKLRIYSKFFGVPMLRSLEVYICIGNTGRAGRGNSFCSNKSIIFPRNFKNYNKKSLQKDFKVAMHEIIHLLYGKLGKNKGFVECLTRAFAPKGLLFNKEGMDKKSTEYKIAMLIEEAIKSEKNYNEIRNELIRVYRKKDT